MGVDILLQHDCGGDGCVLMAGVERGVVWAKEVDAPAACTEELFVSMDHPLAKTQPGFFHYPN